MILVPLEPPQADLQWASWQSAKSLTAMESA